ncbi:hypothetical protein SDC9_99935 [bioreactor metagenome]|uniref:Uncharacterized protein n=1 Tax=bioreactor metagenome TaxID=1076179 RepID=A0A645AJ67_9ZZZZ|nr:hypothetical protein [Oscillospiraceae bacterium]
MKFRIYVEVVGKRWAGVIVHDAKSFYKAQILISDMPDIKQGDNLFITAKAVLMPDKRIKTYRLMPITEEKHSEQMSVISQENNMIHQVYLNISNSKEDV